MHLDNRKSPLHLPAGRHPCSRQQEDAGLALGELYKGVGGFPARLPETLLTSLYGVSLNKGQCKVLQQIQ
jgi:hypothetical protein